MLDSIGGSSLSSLTYPSPQNGSEDVSTADKLQQSNAKQQGKAAEAVSRQAERSSSRAEQLQKQAEQLENRGENRIREAGLGSRVDITV
ncbi:hypothetical protein [Roseibium suaedae]|uniref:Uncharacterized protein n=1 Tax=Roseibium suaedae TaxID=735517 RepID=A0A1M7MTE3_9HYPH|nr:hypothetical protein [Roseibium suaedae]SHM93798.1 hypothetical protein SAMN05444272_3524 [Roseibium suaedae]